MREPNGIVVRVSQAALEADLAAVVQPGVSCIVLPRVESGAHLRQAHAHITRLERLRGVRPGTIEIRPLIESPAGVTMVHEIATSSPRIQTLGLGPTIRNTLDGEALAYASAECELYARANQLTPHDMEYLLD